MFFGTDVLLLKNKVFSYSNMEMQRKEVYNIEFLRALRQHLYNDPILANLPRDSFKKAIVQFYEELSLDLIIYSSKLFSKSRRPRCFRKANSAPDVDTERFHF